MTGTFDLPPVKIRRSPEWILAVVLTGVVVLLHLYFLTCAGGLWRDEVNSVNIANGSWSQMSHDSFPFLFPTLLRAWDRAGFGNSDGGLRLLGVLLSLSLTAVFWLVAWWQRRLPPLWTLVLAAQNPWVIGYAASLRPYGLGSALIALCGGAAWLFLARPGKKSWLLFAAAATLSVQCLFQNTALVAAICSGACVVGWLRKDFRLVGGIFLGGLAAAVSLLPYIATIRGVTHNPVLMRTDFKALDVLGHLRTLFGSPMPQYLWVWTGLAGLVLVRAAMGMPAGRRDERSIFAAVVIVGGVIAYYIFLRLANFMVQDWYFLPLLALVATMLENALPRLEGKFRAARWGAVLATAVLSTVLALHLLDYRFTNLDVQAKRIAAAAHEKDFAIVKLWPYGITFDHYFKNACAWDTIPPLGDHSTHRYDLVSAQMKNPHAMDPFLEKVETTLRAGHAVWIVGGSGHAGSTNAAADLFAINWSEMGCYDFIHRLNEFLERHVTDVQCLDSGINDDVNFNERAGLFKVTGWKN